MQKQKTCSYFHVVLTNGFPMQNQTKIRSISSRNAMIVSRDFTRHEKNIEKTTAWWLVRLPLGKMME